jgi:hypothetical protein
MLIASSIQARSNVFITARERGKKVPALCREGHNRWVNFGREFLTRVVRPAADWSHYSPDVVKFMGFGIGGEFQTITITGDLATHYPGQASFADDDITVSMLERPIKVSGTAGVGSSPGVWLQPIIVDGDTPSTIGSPATTIEFMALFNDSGELDLSGAYTNIPLSEIGLFDSSEVASLQSDAVYNYSASPAYIGASRQSLLAYHPFSPVTKTPSISLEVRWQLQF